MPGFLTWRGAKNSCRQMKSILSGVLTGEVAQSTGIGSSTAHRMLFINGAYLNSGILARFD